MCTVLGYMPCCSGLVSRYVKTSMKNQSNEIVCIEEMTKIRCVKAGDGICGTGEDWCVSPEDCPKPSPESLELYPL